MKRNKQLWIAISAAVVLIMITTPVPEIIALGVLIDGISLETFFLLLEVQLVMILGCFYQSHIRPILLFVHSWLTRIDPLFFIPSRSCVAKYPPILFHALPGLLSLYWLIIFSAA